MRSYWCKKYGNKVGNKIKFIEFFRMLSKDYNLFFFKKVYNFADAKMDET